MQVKLMDQSVQPFHDFRTEKIINTLCHCGIKFRCSIFIRHIDDTVKIEKQNPVDPVLNPVSQHLPCDSGNTIFF